MIPNEIKELEHAIATKNNQLIIELLFQILTREDASSLIREYRHLFFQIIPELERIYGFEQHNSWHQYDVFEHTMKVIDNTEPNPILRLAALFHDIGKPNTFFTDDKGIGHFYGHQKVSLEIFRRFAEKYNLNETIKKAVGALIYHHDGHLSTKKGKMQNLINELGKENIRLLFALKRADNLAQNPEKAAPVLEELETIEEAYNKMLNNTDPSLTKGLK